MTTRAEKTIRTMKKMLQESLAKIDTLERQTNNLIQAYARMMLLAEVHPDKLVEDIIFLLTYEIPIEVTPALQKLITQIVKAIQESTKPPKEVMH